MTSNQRHQAGFSMIEVLIGAALIAIAAAALMTFSGSIASQRAQNQQTLDFATAVESIEQITQSESTCRLALGGPDVVNGAAPAYAQTMNPAGTAQTIKIYPPKTGLKTPFMDLTTSNKFGAWTVTGLTIQPLTAGALPPGPTTVPSFITVTMTNLATNDKRTTNNIYLVASVDAAYRIVSCYNLTYAPDGNPVPLCPSSDYAFSSSGTFVGCRKIKCSVGVPNGYDVNGNIICL